MRGLRPSSSSRFTHMSRERSAQPQYVLGGRVFNTQKAAQAHAKEILNRVPLLQPLGGDDALFVQDLFLLHPERDEKLACNRAQYYFVRKHPEWPNRNFMVRRSDGADDHFSYRFALRLMPRRLWFGIAARHVVDPQKRAYRDAYFARHADAAGRAPCELTGQLVAPTECDVHHAGVLEFRHIVRSFLEERGLDPETVEYVGTTDGAPVLTLADDRLADDFAHYHADRALLQVVSRTAHRSIPKGPPRA